jgi:hypothetical protein
VRLLSNVALIQGASIYMMPRAALTTTLLYVAHDATLNPAASAIYRNDTDSDARDFLFKGFNLSAPGYDPALHPPLISSTISLPTCFGWIGSPNTPELCGPNAVCTSTAFPGMHARACTPVACLP